MSWVDPLSLVLGASLGFLLCLGIVAAAEPGRIARHRKMIVKLMGRGGDHG